MTETLTTSEKLISITCDPEGVVCCFDNEEDNKIMQEIIEDVKALEKK